MHLLSCHLQGALQLSHQPLWCVPSLTELPVMAFVIGWVLANIHDPVYQDPSVVQDP